MRQRVQQGIFVLVLIAGSVAGTPDVRGAGDAQRVSSDGLWEMVGQLPQAPASKEPWVRPEAFVAVVLKQESLLNTLAAAPQEKVVPLRDSNAVITLPMPDGSFARFRIVESPVMAPALAAKFPQIKTYLGWGVDDPAASARLDWTPQGFHAQILSPKGAVYIDPYWKGDTASYATYYKRDLGIPPAFRCLTPPPAAPGGIAAAVAPPSGDLLNTYRLACAATGEYTQYHGGTVADGMAAIVTAVNRVTGIYEVEVAVRMELIANNDWIVYTDGATDPYSNLNGSAMLNQNQSNLDTVIGSADYDIGHVFSTGGGGIAYLGVVCRTDYKAKGVTGLANPTGDAFYVDYVAHEMGHQFGGRHSFNGINGSCCCGNRSGGSAYEPGSGSTIMAYAGICGLDNLQPHSDPYFHAVSFDEIRNHVTNGWGSACPVVTATGNDEPVVDAGPNYWIPQSTPFVLEPASSSDPNGDPLTYCWEEWDLGPAAALSAPDDGQIPLFRSFNPATSASRMFPRLEDLINNTPSNAEKLPTTERVMEFRVTVRDNRAGGGGVSSDAMQVDVDVDSGPFQVTSPNAPIAMEGEQTILWDVAGTDGPPVSVSLVDILLSTDSGNTFPIVLASNTPNDGSETVTLPDIPTYNARVKVQSLGNIFFDMSDVDFAIGMCEPVQVRPTAAEDWRTTTLDLIGSTTCTVGQCPDNSTCLDEICSFPYSRFLYFNPEDAGQPVALQITEVETGEKRWVDPDNIQPILHNNLDPAMFYHTSVLPEGSMPTYAEWHAVTGGNPMAVTGCFISGRRGADGGPRTYEIRAIAQYCDPNDPASFSSPLTLTTSHWTDALSTIASPPEEYARPPQGVVDVLDMTGVVAGFQNLDWTSKMYFDLCGTDGNDCSDTNMNIDVLDMTMVVDGFGGGSYRGRDPDQCP